MINIQLDNLLQLLLSNLADSSFDLGDFPDENFTVCCASDSLFSARKEDSLCVGVLLLRRVVLTDGRSIVLESLRLVGPLHEEDTVLTVTSELVWIHRVELDPVS